MRPEEVLNPNAKPTPPSPTSPPKMLNTRERYVPATSEKSDDSASKLKLNEAQSNNENEISSETIINEEITKEDLQNMKSIQMSAKPNILIRQEKIEKCIEPITFLPEKTMKIEQINHINNDKLLLNVLPSSDITLDDSNISPTATDTSPSIDSSALVLSKITNTAFSDQESSPSTNDEFPAKITATNYPESNKYAHNHPYSLLFIGIILGLIIMTIILKEVFQRGLTPTLQETLNSIFR